jgi:PAS domain S-box-containing protein
VAVVEATGKADGASSQPTKASLSSQLDKGPRGERAYAEAIMNAIGDPMVVLDPSRCVQFANPSFYRTFRLSPQETLTRPLYELNHGQWNIPWLRILLEDAPCKNKPVESLEVEHSFEPVGMRTLRIKAQSLFPDGDLPELTLLALEDITERKQVERALREAKDYAERIVATVAEPLLVLDSSLRVKLANDSFYRAFQVMPAETEGRFLYELGNRQWDIPRLRSLLEEILPLDHYFNNFEVEHPFERIGRRTMRLNARYLDKVEMILLAIEDITERKRAEEATRRLAAIVECSEDAIIAHELDGTVTAWNAGAERQYRYLDHEMIGQSVSRLIPTDLAQEMAQTLETVKQGKRASPFETRHIRKDGKQIHVSASMCPIKDASGRVIGVSTISRDITERRLMQKDVLEIAAKERRRIGQDLHEIVGQELTGLGLMASNLVETLWSLSRPEAELAGRIAKGLKLALGQVRAMSKGLIPAEVDARSLTAALAAQAARVAEQSAVSCMFQCHEPVPVQDNATANHLYRIAQEAVTNAVRNGRARNIHVSLGTDGQLIILRVQDDGLGVHLCAETGGVGLRIMRYRAGLMNATLNIEPARGGGTLVTCTLKKDDAND